MLQGLETKLHLQAADLAALVQFQCPRLQQTVSAPCWHLVILAPMAHGTLLHCVAHISSVLSSTASIDFKIPVQIESKLKFMGYRKGESIWELPTWNWDYFPCLLSRSPFLPPPSSLLHTGTRLASFKQAWLCCCAHIRIQSSFPLPWLWCQQEEPPPGSFLKWGLDPITLLLKGYQWLLFAFG